MRDKRPVNLDISTIHLPLAAWNSIGHRISGIIVFVGTAFLLWALDISLSSEEGFNQLRSLGSSFISKFIAWGILSALAFHIVAGCKHLLVEFDIGETREAAPIGAGLVFGISAVLAILLGVWIW